MLENTSEDFYVRIEHPKIGKRAIMAMGFALGIGFLICIAVGVTGPSAFIRQPGPQLDVNVDGISTPYQIVVEGLTPLNRMIYVLATLQRPGYPAPSPGTSSTKISFEQEATIMVTGKKKDGTLELVYPASRVSLTVNCLQKEQWCNDIVLFFSSVVEYPEYQVQVIFDTEANETSGIVLVYDILYLSETYTRFTIGWSYFFLGITTLVMFCPIYGYFWVTAKIPPKKWNSLQKWIAALLVFLFLQDDPFLAAEVLSFGHNVNIGLAVTYVFFMANFLAVILFFWLYLIDDIRTNYKHDAEYSTNRWKFRWFVLKLLLCFAIWVSILGTYLSAKRRQMMDPAYNPSEEEDASTSKPYYISTAVFMAIYVFWIMYLFISCFHHVKEMIPGYRFIFFLTFVTILVSIVDVFVVILYPLRGSPVGLLSIFGLYNLYVWVLAAAYTPSSIAKTTHHAQINFENTAEVSVSMDFTPV